MNTLDDAKQELGRWIQAAMGIELATIPPYMMALISIKPGSNRVAANLIRGVMMEEMLHLSLAGNLLSAIGGKVSFTGTNVPSYPLTLKFDGKGFKDREFEVDLGAFSAQNIETFIEIELPEGWPEPRLRAKTVSEMDIPGYTIGEFYEEIRKKLVTLCEQFGEEAVFSGNPKHQLDLNYYWAGGGRPIIIRDLASASKAIELIVTQGEGTARSIYDKDRNYFAQPNDVAHFFRFREIAFGRRYKIGDAPHEPPTGESFDVDYSAVFPIKTNPRASDYSDDPVLSERNDAFNRLYSMMLFQIAEALNGAPGAMYTAILTGMHDITAIAREMVARPIAGDPEGRHGAPSFEWRDPIP